MSDTRRAPLVILLVTIMGAQTIAMAALSALLVLQFVQADTQSAPTAVALIALVVLIVVWLVAMTAGVWRARASTRGSVLVYQFLQLAIGVGSLQGFIPRPDIASWIIIPSVVGIIVVLTPTVTDYLSERG